MAVYMLIIFIVDLIILNQYVHTYFDEISFRKKLSSYEWILELLMVLSKCLYELIMTQIGLFKIFTDYSFIYIVSQDPSLRTYFVFIIISFSVFLISKVYWLVLIFKIMCTCYNFKQEKISVNQNKNNLYSLIFEEDVRRQTVHTAFTFSEFRCHSLCVRNTKYEISKNDIYMSSLKFLAQDLPSIIIQISFLQNTTCGIYNKNISIYLSILISVLNICLGFIFNLLVYAYHSKQLFYFKTKL